MCSGQILEIERLASVTRLVVNRPPANALNTALAQQLTDAIATLAEAGAPPVVLAAAGDRFFCPGGDIKEFETIGREGTVARMHGFHKLITQIEHYPGPFVCAVKGYAVGGGFELTLFADAVVAGPGAQFGFPEINHGLLPAGRGMRQAARLLGLRAAKAMLYSGTFMKADEARAAGLVNEVVPTAEVDARAETLAAEWGSKDREILSAMKHMMNRAEEMSREELDAATLRDVGEQLSREEASEARQRFLSRSKGAA